MPSGRARTKGSLVTPLLRARKLHKKLNSYITCGGCAQQAGFVGMHESPECCLYAIHIGKKEYESGKLNNKELMNFFKMRRWGHVACRHQENQIPMWSSGHYRTGWEYYISKFSSIPGIGLTKEIVKNYFSAFNTLFVRWRMFRGEPVIAALRHQVVNHFFINQCTPRLEITFPSLDEGITGIRALLDNPKNVRDRREWLRIVVRGHYKQKGGLVRPMRHRKEGDYLIANTWVKRTKRMGYILTLNWVFTTSWIFTICKMQASQQNGKEEKVG